MPKKSATSRTVRRQAADIRPATAADLARLRAAASGPINTSDIPERTGVPHRVARDDQGRRPSPSGSPIREAILAALERRGMTRYALWLAARGRCATLSQSAVYEYLRGRRDIGTRYAEALMQATGLSITVGKTVLPAGGAQAARRGTAGTKAKAVQGR